MTKRDLGEPAVFRLALKENSCPAGELDVTNPYDGSVVARVETAGTQDVQQSLDTAFRLFRNRKTWQSIAERIGVLERVVRIMLREKHSLSMTATREGGKPFLDSQLEVEKAIDGVRCCIERLRSPANDVVLMGRTKASSGRGALARLEPVGVVIAVSAFSDPLNLVVTQLAAAVAAGCPIIVNPAIDTPLSCLRFADILRKAGLPVEWCQVIVTDDGAVADALISDPRVALISFTGTREKCRRLQSKLAPSTSCTIGRSGTTPVILMHDANEASASTSICRRGFYHAGQARDSMQRVFVPTSCAHAFGASLAARAAALTVGDPRKPDTDVGPLIRNVEVERVHAWVGEAIATGARLLTGGSAIGASMYQPTVLIDPPSDANMNYEEIVGPILCVHAYETVDDVIETVNISPLAYDATVFTRHIDTAMQFFEHADASLVVINDQKAFRCGDFAIPEIQQSDCILSGFARTIDQMQVRKTLILNSPE